MSDLVEPGHRVVLEQGSTLRAVTVIMASVVALTFLFGFGNVWALAARLGVPPWVAPLVAPAVDLSVIGLLLATRYLAVRGVGEEAQRSARRLLVFSSLVTLALNVAEPVLAGQYGKAAFDAVGPSLLIGWAEVGPALLQAISQTGDPCRPGPWGGGEAHPRGDSIGGSMTAPPSDPDPGQLPAGGSAVQVNDELLDRAHREDEAHRREHGRPISAETLRRRLHVGAARSRALVRELRVTA